MPSFASVCRNASGCPGRKSRPAGDPSKFPAAPWLELRCATGRAMRRFDDRRLREALHPRAIACTISADTRSQRVSMTTSARFNSDRLTQQPARQQMPIAPGQVASIRTMSNRGAVAVLKAVVEHQDFTSSSATAVAASAARSGLASAAHRAGFLPAQRLIVRARRAAIARLKRATRKSSGGRSVPRIRRTAFCRSAGRQVADRDDGDGRLVDVVQPRSNARLRQAIPAR